MKYIYLFFPLILNVGIMIWIFIDAKKREYETDYAFLWVLGRLWFGPIALGVWIVVRPKFVSESAKLCPSCREWYEKDPALCPHCGHILKEGIVDISSHDNNR